MNTLLFSVLLFHLTIDTVKAKSLIFPFNFWRRSLTGPWWQAPMYPAPLHKVYAETLKMGA